MLGRLLARFLRRYVWLLVGVAVFQLAQAIAALYLPTLNADIIDDGVATGDTELILQLGAIMLGVSLIQIVCQITAVSLGARAAMGFGRDVRAAVFNRVMSFGEQEVSRFSPPSLITRSTNDVQQVQMLVLMGATILVSAPLMAIGGIVMAVRQDAELSSVLVVAIPVLLLAVGLIVAKMHGQFQLMQERIDNVNRILREQLTGIRVIRAFVREPEEKVRFRGANDDLTATALVAGRRFALMFPIVMLVLNTSSVAVVWFGAFEIDEGRLEVGSLIAFLNYLVQILMSVMMSTMLAMILPRAVVSGERIVEVLETEPSVGVPANPVRSLTETGSVVFRTVSFQYPGADEPVLSEIDFTARPGVTTAIIGSTGSGKTTLANLIPRLFDVTAGAVLVDGVDVRELDPDVLWSRIGFIPQRAFLFSGTVASNLRYGNPDASDEELWRALEIAQARDFVEAMPGQLEARISQGGTNVSGGQRQRLAIARALVKRPEIYVFDDAFSALDTATDARLRAALDAEAQHATRIVVAQRVATIRDADQIIVLDAGRIVARGTHDELLDSSPEYAEIVASQLSAEEVA